MEFFSSASGTVDPDTVGEIKNGVGSFQGVNMQVVQVLNIEVSSFQEVRGVFISFRDCIYYRYAFQMAGIEEFHYTHLRGLE